MRQREIVRLIVAQRFIPFDRRDDELFPGWIRVGDSGLIIPREMGQLIRKLSKQLYEGDKALRRSTTLKDWTAGVRQAIAPLLLECDPSEDPDIATSRVLDRLKVALSSLSGQLLSTFIFGCSVIHDAQCSQISLGPVTLWSRQAWLDHALAEEAIDTLTHGRLSKTVNSKASPTPPAGEAVEGHGERAFIDAIGTAPFVCSVRTEGLFGEAAKDKAALAARLALTTIALVISDQPSAILERMNLRYDGPPYQRTHVRLIGGKLSFAGLEPVRSLRGPHLRKPWAQISQENAGILDIAGEVIAYILSSSGKVDRPALMDTLAHSLLWFDQACREDMAMIAVTKFVAAMDCLAHNSGGATGLIKLVTARLAVDPEDTIREGGPTFRYAITELYGEGRSQPDLASVTRLP